MGTEKDLVVRPKHLILLFMAAILLRVSVMLLSQTWQFDNEWAFGFEMGRLGKSLVEGNGFILRESPTAAFPPLYPLVIAGFFWLLGVFSLESAVAIFLFQSICAAVTTVLLVVIGTRLWNRAAGFTAALVWIFYPTSIFYSVVRVWYCELAIMLVLLAIVIAMTAHPPLTSSRIALLGAISGLAVLTDSTLLVYLPALLLWMLFVHGAPVSRFATLAPVWVFAFGLVVAPWAIHNWIFLGSPTIIKSNFGRELFVGNFPHSQSTSSSEDKTNRQSVQTDAAQYKEQSEILYNRYLLARTMDWILSNPAEFTRLTLRRMQHFWVTNPHLGRTAWVRLSYYGPLLMLAIYGLCLAVGRSRPLAPVWLFLLIYPVPFYLTHVVNGRYSYPIEPFITLLAAIPLAIWLKGRRSVVTEPGIAGGALTVKREELGAEG